MYTCIYKCICMIMLHSIYVYVYTDELCFSIPPQDSCMLFLCRWKALTRFDRTNRYCEKLCIPNLRFPESRPMLWLKLSIASGSKHCLRSSFTLLMIVNFISKTLPFRRYDWIHGDDVAFFHVEIWKPTPNTAGMMGSKPAMFVYLHLAWQCFMISHYFITT